MVVFGNIQEMLKKYKEKPGWMPLEISVKFLENTREILGKYPGNTWVVVFWASVAQLAETEMPEETEDESRRLALPACRLSAFLLPVKSILQPVQSLLQPVCLGGLCSGVQPAPTLTRGGSGSRPKSDVA